MSIKEFINNIKTIGSNHKLINYSSIDYIDEVWNSTDIKYPAFNVMTENISVELDDPTVTVNIVLYYGDRLLQDGSNLQDIQSDAVRVLNLIVNKISNLNEVNAIGSYTIELWKQQFTDILAGGYIKLSVMLTNEVDECWSD